MTINLDPLYLGFCVGALFGVACTFLLLWILYKNSKKNNIQ